MDPTATLENMRRLAAAILKGELSVDEFEDAAYELAGNINDMDEWLMHGGFLPKDWSR